MFTVSKFNLCCTIKVAMLSISFSFESSDCHLHNLIGCDMYITITSCYCAFWVHFASAKAAEVKKSTIISLGFIKSHFFTYNAKIHTHCRMVINAQNHCFISE